MNLRKARKVLLRLAECAMVSRGMRKGRRALIWPKPGIAMAALRRSWKAGDWHWAEMGRVGYRWVLNGDPRLPKLRVKWRQT